MFHFDESTTIGFSGSRAPSVASVCALRSVLAALPSEVSVVVGCASGIDALVRSACPSARVFQARDYGIGRGALAARSIACVRAVAAAGGVWVSFPDAPCPAGLRPSSSLSACLRATGRGRGRRWHWRWAWAPLLCVSATGRFGSARLATGGAGRGLVYVSSDSIATQTLLKRTGKYLCFLYFRHRIAL